MRRRIVVSFAAKRIFATPTRERHMLLRTMVILRMLDQSARDLLRRESGANAVEYGIMLAAIAAVIIAVVILVGGELGMLLTDLGTR
jgi:Flp pilus assembly pilin Flp